VSVGLMYPAHGATITGQFAPSSAPIGAGLPMMGMDDDRARFSIAVFYDIDRLLAALAAFEALGIDANDLWLGARPGQFDLGTPLHDALAKRGDSFQTLISQTAALASPASDKPLCATKGRVLEFLQTTRLQNGKTCLESLLEGNTGGILQDHADKGAVILIARMGSASLQDQGMRILLRHSLHMVYSRECRPDRDASAS